MTVLSSLRASHVLVILLLLMFSPAVGFSASNTLTGEVALPTRSNGMQTVRVFIIGHGYSRNTVTRVDGSFNFENVPPGDYVIEVHYPGHETGRLELQNWSPNELRQVVVPLGRAIDQDDLPVGPNATTTVKELKVPEKALREMTEAQQKSKRQDYQGAIKHLRRALDICPTLADAWNNLGVAYMRTEREVDAEIAFKKALSNDPRCSQALRNLGLLYFTQKRNREAIERLKPSLEGNSTDYQTQTYLAVAFYREGNYTESEAWLQKALRAKPDFTDALFQLALVQFRTKDYEGAADSADRYLASAPNGDYSERVRQLKAAVDRHLTKSAE